MRAQLLPLDAGVAIEVTKDMSIVGRGEECDIRLDHKSVSKIHCVLVKTDGVLLLRDLGSTNGTRVNGTRIRRAVLLPNDKLSIANRHFRALFGAALKDVAGDQTTQIDPLLEDPVTQDNEPDAIDSEPESPVVEVQTNALPDVYPDGDPRKT